MVQIGLQDGALQARAARVIPGGMYGHLSNRLLPAGTPQYFVKARGARIWDADGREYIDYMSAWGPNLLGYGDARVQAAADRQQALGDAMTGPSPVMVDLAEAMVAMVDHADWAMFAKNGTDVTTMAMTTARSQTGKRRILVAAGAYHGAAPWCTPFLAGVLPEDRAHLRQYIYNDIASLEAAVADAGDDLAGVFASPVKHDAFVDQELPDPAYARRCRELCDETGAMLIAEEVRTGLRVARDCSWSPLGIKPDLSCWGKAIANGYPIAALLGSDKAREGAARIFTTGTFWFQAVPMAAALATLEITRTTDYLEHTIRLGSTLREGLAERASAHGFSLRQTGPVQMPLVLFDEDPDFRLGVAFAGAMMQKGVYFHPWHNMFLCAAMTDDDIALTLDAAEHAFANLTERRFAVAPHVPIVDLLATVQAPA